ncbi:MAG: ABC transporter ATP-binding protein [Myxococcales bacterium]|nr:ABC transporter ATP-binding protein [Myxococcales bacterium]
MSSASVEPRRAPAGSGVELVGLGKTFGSRTAVEGLTFEVRPGEVFGLLGPNGSGKTTTVRLLTGLLSASSGRARVCGVPIGVGSQELRRIVGLLTEQPGLYDRLSGAENLRFFIKVHELEERQAWPRARRYLERFGLAGREQEACGTYSKGMRQKLAIIRALLHEPRVLFLDEPTSGLDPEAAHTVRDAVAELASEGRTIILCSHNLAEVEQLCARVAVVKNRLLAVAPVPELRTRAFTLEVRLEGEASRFLPSLAGLPLPGPPTADQSSLRVPLSGEEQAPDVVSALVAAGARIYSAARAGRALEEVYLELVREKEALR